MKKIKFVIFIWGVIGIMAPGCKKEDNEIKIDPTNPILGKWEMTEMGNWPYMETVKTPTGYQEYLPDSILKEYEYKTGIVYIKKYWIDSLLHVGTAREDGFQLIFTYKYNFSDKNNKLQLDINALMTFNTSVYKRIK